MPGRSAAAPERAPRADGARVQTPVLLFAAVGLFTVVTACVGVGFLITQFRPGTTTSWSPMSVNESKARGRVLIDALAGYRRAEGRFPASLGDIALDRDPALLRPVTGNDAWLYIPAEDGASYRLRFTAEGGHPSAEYDSRRGGWIVAPLDAPRR